MLTVAVIPARGGSRGLPGKHLRRLGGVPLIVHTIRAAHAARRVNRTIVSTDDPAIARAARRAGADVPFLRPAELATDETPTAPVIEHAIAWIEERGDAVDTVVTLQPTSPLRTAAQIDDAIALLDVADATSAVTVAPLDVPMSTIGWIQDGRLCRGQVPDDVRRQASPVAVRITGGIYVTRRALLREGRLLDERPAALLVDARSAIDVDTAGDLLAARRAWKARRS